MIWSAMSRGPHEAANRIRKVFNQVHVHVHNGLGVIERKMNRTFF